MFRSKSTKQPAMQVETLLSSARRGVSKTGSRARVAGNKKRLRAKNRARNRMEKDKTFSPLQGIAGLALILVLAGWSLEQLKVGSDLIEFSEYHRGRIVLLVSAYVLVLISAFQISVIQGLFCTLFPPYMIYFVFVPMESSALKGVIIGLGIFIGVEHKQLKKDSVYTLVDQTLSNLAGDGRDVLNKVSGGHY